MVLSSMRLQVFVGAPDLKKALEEYASDKNTSVSALIADAWEKMILSHNFTLMVKTLYHESSEKGISVKENQAATRINISIGLGLLDRVDKIVKNQKELNRGTVFNRNLFNLEALRRYVEPELIEHGYLSKSIFKEEELAVKNLIALREKLQLTKKDFHRQFFCEANESRPFISFPQYALIERTSRGNILRLVNHISKKLNLDSEIFYLPTDEFLNRLKPF